MMIEEQNISVFEYLFLIFITVKQKSISSWLAKLQVWYEFAAHFAIMILEFVYRHIL